MKKQKIKDLIKEFNIILLLFILFYLFWQIHYSKENILIVLKLVIAHFYLFIIVY